MRHQLASFKQRLSNLEAEVAKTGAVLTEAQVTALERKREDDLACEEIETAHPGYLGKFSFGFLIFLNQYRGRPTILS